jgi:3-dehydroquinate dehydratase
MTLYTEELFLGAQEAYSALWPGQRTPTDPVDLGNDLQLSKVRLQEWRDSGARVGADEALSYFLSWYEKADLETLRTVREGSIWTADPEHIRRRQELAHSYVDYTDIEAFVWDICEPEKTEDDAKDAADAEGSDSSQDEEETEEADTDAPE